MAGIHAQPGQRAELAGGGKNRLARALADSPAGSPAALLDQLASPGVEAETDHVGEVLAGAESRGLLDHAMQFREQLPTRRGRAEGSWSGTT
jgi:hypothetical protein